MIQEIDEKISIEMKNLKETVSNIRAEIIDTFTGRLND